MRLLDRSNKEAPLSQRDRRMRCDSKSCQLLHSCKKLHFKSNLFAISSVQNITIHEFALRLAGQTGDNFALMSAHDN